MKIENLDLIAAISTATGPGAVSMVRLSGEGVLRAAARFLSLPEGQSLKARPRALILGKVIQPTTGRLLDHVLAAYFPSPRSFTGEDSLEIQGHGGAALPSLVLEAALSSGARLARPGEFTQRAFLNGRLSLDQAEAVAEIVAAESEAEAAIAAKILDGALRDRIWPLSKALLKNLAFVTGFLDFEEEWTDENSLSLQESLRDAARDLDKLLEIRRNGRVFREGLKVVLAGPPNVGKSSLFNALLGQKRALVSSIAGTTRDYIVAPLSWDSLKVELVDTAGLRDEGADELEAMGRDLALERVVEADLVLWVQDATAPPAPWTPAALPEGIVSPPILEVWNKADLLGQNQETARAPESPESPGERGERRLLVSALAGAGLEELKAAILQRVGARGKAIPEFVPNLRQEIALQKTRDKLQLTLKALEDGEYLEIAGLYLREATDALGAITGQVTTEDLLTEVFSHFCLGK
ncbi:MAG: tRNA uridine-5-carboxymethylaminomethyl(34) synthesis GTPase MnmE [Deltaproteobacteria bacterium]|jgi:tRNA modification GTPase|nr:tRNA uridine-5-carboxymethylaminomethyl(34) synthesis GTPase MnmE [Deltaproteobacteria bacterium]